MKSHSRGCQPVVSAGSSHGWKSQVSDGGDSTQPLAYCIINLGRSPVWLSLHTQMVFTYTYRNVRLRCVCLSIYQGVKLKKRDFFSWNWSSYPIHHRIDFPPLADISSVIHLWRLTVFSSLTMKNCYFQKNTCKDQLVPIDLTIERIGISECCLPKSEPPDKDETSPLSSFELFTYLHFITIQTWLSVCCWIVKKSWYLSCALQWQAHINQHLTACVIPCALKQKSLIFMCRRVPLSPVECKV